MGTIQMVLLVIASWFAANLLGVLFIWLADGRKALGFTLGFLAVGSVWASVWVWQLPYSEFVRLIPWGV
ncbi:hypothetical protein VPZ60_004331 [Salmonella enterica]|nr:hypothetical protein [Salmonella enterica]